MIPLVGKNALNFVNNDQLRKEEKIGIGSEFIGPRVLNEVTLPANDNEKLSNFKYIPSNPVK